MQHQSTNALCVSVKDYFPTHDLIWLLCRVCLVSGSCVCISSITIRSFITVPTAIFLRV
jgi:hypothetical protein